MSSKPKCCRSETNIKIDILNVNEVDFFPSKSSLFSEKISGRQTPGLTLGSPLLLYDKCLGLV
jgi:hypothetical protein